MSDLHTVIARLRTDDAFRDAVRRRPADVLRPFELDDRDLRAIERELDGDDR